ncbi:uncharacterized protein LOC143300591 [Babylonia areolata]|uniref:uncharacterized protein LOC143300591 n=1 Tax=Babylonia areolata TaxID=304850 RepID=UPI003FCFF91E
MKSLLAFLSCVVCLGGVLVLGGPSSSLLQDKINVQCGRSYMVSTAATVTGRNIRVSRTGETTCSVRIDSYFHGYAAEDNKVRVSVQSLQASCGQSYLQIFDGRDDRHEYLPLSDKLCGDMEYQQTMFLSTQENYITVEIHSDMDSPVSFTMLVTATSYSYESGDFICKNLLYVDRSLKCDGNNNCGDWSDEDDYLCDDLLSWNWQITLIVVFAWLVFVVVVVLVIKLVAKRRIIRRQCYGNVSVTSSSSTRPPNYGGVMPTSPPPYAPRAQSSHVQLPPPPPYKRLQSTPPPPPPPPSLAQQPASESSVLALGVTSEAITTSTTVASSGVSSTSNITGDCHQ